MRLIDADAAIDAVVGCTNCETEDVLRAYVTKHSLENGWTGGIVDALDAIEQLPSAEPEAMSEWKKEFREYVDSLDITRDDWKGIIGYIDELPSVQLERPTGEWIQKPRYEDDEYPDAQPNLKCPFCGYEIGWCDMGNYCARCGADLKGGAE